MCRLSFPADQFEVPARGRKPAEVDVNCYDCRQLRASWNTRLKKEGQGVVKPEKPHRGRGPRGTKVPDRLRGKRRR